MGKTTCVACNKKCKGQAIKLSEANYIHPKCFTCKECKKELPLNAFFIHNNARYCTLDYQRLFGTKCESCGKYVEGEVVTVLNKTFHRQCITCVKCRKNIGAGNKLTMVSGEFWCQTCVVEAENERTKESTKSPDTSTELKTSEMTQAERNQLASPVSDFGADTRDGEENVMMSPDFRSPISVTSGYKSDVSTDLDFSGVEKSPGDMAETSLTVANYSSLDNSNYETEPHGYLQHDPNGQHEFGKFYPTSFLDKGTGFKRGPSINPREKHQQHFHKPDDFSYRKVRSDIIIRHSKPGMMNSLGNKSQTSSLFRRTSEPPYRPNKSQEAIQLAKIPDAQRFSYDHKMPIERDDFVAPPEPAAVCPELLRDLIFRKKSVQNGDVVDADNNKENEGVEMTTDPKIEKEISELSKISTSGAAQMILEELKKKKLAEPRELDPRSSSRSPSAATEPFRKIRYESPVFASPSRDIFRTKFWLFDDARIGKNGRCFTPSVPRPGYGLRSRTLDHRNGTMSAMSFRGNNAFDPGPGHRSSLGTRSATLGVRNGYTSDTTDGYYPSNYMSYHRRPESSTATTERQINTPVSDAEDYDPTTGLRVTRSMFQRLNILVDGRLTPGSRSSLRRNIPVIFAGDQEVAKIFPYESLRLDSKNRPSGLDNSTLEQYLADDEFEQLFRMPRLEFMSLAEWKRNDLKQRVALFQSSEKPATLNISLEKPPTPIAT